MSFILTVTASAQHKGLGGENDVAVQSGGEMTAFIYIVQYVQGLLQIREWAQKREGEEEEITREEAKEGKKTISLR